MKKTFYAVIFLALFLSPLSFGLRDYEIDTVLRPGLENRNHFGLAYNPNSDHLFLGRGSDGLGYLSEIDLNGNVINDRQLGDGTFTHCYVRELSYDSSTGHLFALMTTQISNTWVQRIWEMGTDLQTIYNDISLQQVMDTSDYLGFSGLHVDNNGIWLSNSSSELFHLSRNYDVLNTKASPVRLTTLSSSPDGGFVAMEYDIFAGEKDIYEFDSELNHISTTGVNSTFDVSTTYGIWNIETYQNKMFLSNNFQIYVMSATIPEPATVVLLGLGAVVLRRRKSE